MPGQGGRFAGHTFHQIAVRDNCEGKMTDYLKSRPVEFGGQVSFGNRHTNPVCESLSKRASGRLDARS